jgi:hypothetical protein
MTVCEAPNSLAERRLAIARRLYGALVAHQSDRVFTLRDGQGQVLASNASTRDQNVVEADQVLGDQVLGESDK